MAQGNCLVKIPAIGRNQPPRQSDQVSTGGCNGAHASYPIPYDMNLCSNSSNVEVSVDADCRYQRDPVRFDGTGYLGQGINEEIAKDILEINTVYSAKIHYMRRYEKTRILKSSL